MFHWMASSWLPRSGKVTYWAYNALIKIIVSVSFHGSVSLVFLINQIKLTQDWSTRLWPVGPWKVYTFFNHWGRVTHICVSKLTIIGSDNGLSPGRPQAITLTNAGILMIGPLGTNFGEISIDILTFSFKKIRFKMSSGKWRPFCLGVNVLTGNAESVTT